MKPPVYASDRSEKVLAMARQAGVLRARDLTDAGLARAHLRRLVEAGRLERVERGLYVLSDAEPTEYHLLAEVSKRVPEGVVCLLSALAFHHLTPETPKEVWLDIGRDAHRPQVTRWPLRIAHFSGLARTFGVEEHQVEGVTVHVSSPAKTVADCFKYRSKLGQQVALEALRETWRARRATVSELWEAAQICRVTSSMRPYLEIVSSF